MHQAIANVLHTLLYNNPPHMMTHSQDIVDQAMATATYSKGTTVATTLGSTPRAAAFGRDMFLNVPLIANWQAVASHCKHHVNENLC